MFLFTKEFWFGSGDVFGRAIRTVAQTAVGVIGTGVVGILDVDWQGVVSASLLAGILSVLMSIANQKENTDA
jgi:hypothetical protein